MEHQPDIFFISHRFSTHSRSSGYDRLTDFIPEGKIVTPTVRSRYYSKLVRELVRSKLSSRGCEPDAAASEASIYLRRWLSSRRIVCHYIYGENCLGWLKPTENRRIVASFHQPATVISHNFVSNRSLNNVSAAIALSNQQAVYLFNTFPGLNVRFIPHGVDTVIFNKSYKENNVAGPWQCLVVGGYLRDWDTFNRVVELCTKNNANEISFTVITSQGEFKNLRPSRNLTVVGGVSEDSLLAYYHSCDMVVLPLTDCVASNSLLEGLACGKPVIVTDVGGVRDYADESCARLVPRAEPEAIYDSISVLLDDVKLRTQMAIAARARAERFAWPKIADQVRHLYSQVFQ